MEYSELLKWASEPETDGNKDYIDQWYASLDQKNDDLNKLAIFLAESFVRKDVSFEIANTLFNQIMPVAGFEEAPDVFWQFYIAFEDFEPSERPNIDAIPRIKSELKKVHAL